MKWRKYGTIWLLIFTSAIFLGTAYYYGAVGKPKEKEPAVYSVILYQNTDNEWQTLMDGIEQAKKDYRVKIRYMNLAEGDTAKEQAELIQQEIEAGAQGIIYAAVDSEGLKDELKNIHVQIPMVSVETGTGEGVNISSDNYEMGRELGEKILRDIQKEEGHRRVTVIYEYQLRNSVKERYEGLRDALRSSGEDISVQLIARRKGDFSLSLFIGTSFSGSGEYIAALDKFSTQEAAKAWNSNQRIYEDEGKRLKIYGIGNTAQTVSDLDSGLLTALVYQNEFNMGYEAVQALVEKEKKGYITENFNIMHKLVTRETLYESENERLLFPNS